MGQLAVRGAMWTAGGAFIIKIVNSLGYLLLGFLLVKEDFGKLAMAYTITSVATVISNPGLTDIVVHRGNRLRRWATPIFWLSILLGGGVALLLVGIAPLAAAFYGESELAWVISIIACSIFIANFSLVSSSMLSVQMRFKLSMSVSFVQAAFQIVLTVILSALGYGVFSLVIPLPLTQLLRTSLIWYFARPPIRLRLEIYQWKFLFTDIRHLIGTRLVESFQYQIPFAITGYLYGPGVVGPFYWGFQVSVQTYHVLIGNLSELMFATLAKISGQPDRLLGVAKKTCTTILLLIAPVCMIQMILAEPLVKWVYGDKWIDAIPIIQGCSLAFIFFSLTILGKALMQSRGQFAHQVKRNVIGLVAMVTLILILSYTLGSNGPAIGLLTHMAVIGPVWVYLALADLGITPMSMITMVLRPLACSLAGITTFALIYYCLVDTFFQNGPAMISAGSVSLLVYLGCSWKYDRVWWVDLINRLRKRRSAEPSAV